VVQPYTQGNASEYMDWMGTKLQRRRIETEYANRYTHTDNDTRSQCVWKHPDIEELIESHLPENYEKYCFCMQCLGSEHDLLAT